MKTADKGWCLLARIGYKNMKQIYLPISMVLSGWIVDVAGGSPATDPPFLDPAAAGDKVNGIS